MTGRFRFGNRLSPYLAMEGDPMFARITRLNLKPGSRVGYTRAIDEGVFPKMKRFNGFAGQISLISSDGKEGIGISLWRRREDGEAYQRKGSTAVMKALENCTEGKPGGPYLRHDTFDGRGASASESGLGPRGWN